MGGVPNLASSVPAHWEARRLGQLGRFYKGSGGTKADMVDAGVPCVRYGDLYTWHQHFIHDTKSYVSETVARDYTRVRHGDVLFAASGETHEDIGRSAEVRLSNGAVCGGDIVGFRPDKAFAPGFLGYAADSQHARHQKARSGRGFTVVHISATALKEMVIAVPPIGEQRRIAAFLDHKTSRIDELVQEQGRLVRLLDEDLDRRLLHLVLGTDQEKPRSEQAHEWAQTAPAGWRRVALRHVSGARCDGPFGSSLRSEHYTDIGVRVIRLQNIRARRFDGNDAVYIDEGYAVSLRHHAVEPGDLLVAGLGDDTHAVGRACVAPPWIGPAIVKADCFRLRLDTSTAEPGFVAAQLSATASIDAPMLANGSTRSRIPLGKMASRYVHLPSIDTQKKIVAELNTLDEQATKLKAEAQRASLLLAERRSALITAAVTGQIDVSTWTPPDDWLSPEAA